MSVEKTYAELQQYHHRAMREDRLYRMEYILDARFEELGWHIPPTYEPEPSEHTEQSPWETRQWKIIDQLRGQVSYLQQRLTTHEEQGRLQPQPAKQAKGKVLKAIET